MWTFNIVQLHNSHAKTSWLSSHVQRSYRHAPFVLHFCPSDVLFINGIRQSTSLVMVLFDIAHCLPIDCVHVCSSCYIPGLTLFAIMPQINPCQHSWLRPETASIWDSHIYFRFSWSLYCGLPSYLIRNYWLVSILVLVQPEITVPINFQNYCYCNRTKIGVSMCQCQRIIVLFYIRSETSFAWGQKDNWHLLK